MVGSQRASDVFTEGGEGPHNATISFKPQMLTQLLWPTFLGARGVRRARGARRLQLAKRTVGEEKGKRKLRRPEKKKRLMKRHVRTSTFWPFPCADVCTVT